MFRDRIVGVYLAAGSSSRMGTDKLRLRLGDKCLGSHALGAALSSKLDYVSVVVNNAAAESEWIDPAYYAERIKRKWAVIHCPEALLGQAWSLRCGVRAAMAAEAAAVMIMLADQPFLSREMIDELVDRYHSLQEDGNIGFVASRHEGVARPPVIFDRSMFQDLLKLQGDQGARHLIRQHASGICLDFASPDLFLDADTPEDYNVLLEKFKLG